MKAQVVLCSEDEPAAKGEIKVWLFSRSWGDEERKCAKASFENGELSIIVHEAGVTLSGWMSKLLVKPTSASGDTSWRSSIFDAGGRKLDADNCGDLDVMRCRWMARVLTRILKLQGQRSFHGTDELSRAIDVNSVVTRSKLRGEANPSKTPLVVAFIGSTKFFCGWCVTLLRYAMLELSRVNDALEDKEIVVVSGGFRNMQEPDNHDDQGVGHTATYEYDKLDGLVVHILPEIDTGQSFATVAEHLSDGAFLPLDFGVTLFSGKSNSERLTTLTQVCDVVFLMEGGPGAALQFKEAVKDPHCAAVPLCETGGAASGLFDMPVVPCPFFIDLEAWNVVAELQNNDKKAEETVPDEKLRGMARAIAEISRCAAYPLDGARQLHSDSTSGDAGLEIRLPTWQLAKDRFVPPLLTAQEGSLKNVISLLRAYERSLRRYSRWSVTDADHLVKILHLICQYLREYVDRSKTEKQIALMSEAYERHGQKFKRVYSTVVQDVIKQEPKFQEFIRVAIQQNAVVKELTKAEGFEVVQRLQGEGLAALLPLFKDAARAMDRLEEFGEKIAKNTSAIFQKAPLKRMWRCMEKMVLKYSDNGDISQAASGLKDIARASLNGNMESLLEALQFVLQDSQVRVVRIKNRFDEPPTTGWADCQVMLYFVRDKAKHICEIQFVHPQLLTVRSNMGAHHTYAYLRAAMEMLQLYKQPLPTLQCLRSMYFCKLRPALQGQAPVIPARQGRPSPAWGSVEEFKAAHRDQAECASRLEELFPKSSATKICKFCGARSAPNITGKCIGCGNELRGHDCESLLCIAFGMADKGLPANGKQILRFESEEMIVSDDPVCWAPLHFRVMPTAERIPDWRHLLLRPEHGTELLLRMREAALQASADFLRDDAWRKFFFKATELPRPLSSDEEVRKFCDECMIAGFLWPIPPGNQLVLQWIIPPMFPADWHSVLTNTHLSWGNWFPLEYVQAALHKVSSANDVEITDAVTKLVATQSKDELFKALEGLKLDVSEQYTSVQNAAWERYRTAQRSLSKWSSMFECVVVDGGTVCQKDSVGQWVPTDVDDFHVVLKDTLDLGCQSRILSSDKADAALGSYYSFPKKLQGYP